MHELGSRAKTFGGASAGGREAGMPAAETTTACRRDERRGKCESMAHTPHSDSEPDVDAVLSRLLSNRECADALELIESLPEVTRPDWLARVWMQVGALRPLRALALAGRLVEPGLVAAVHQLLESGPPPIAIPIGTYAELEDRSKDLARRGLARDLAHCHLGLAEVAPRVDWRVAHVEHASALAEQLDDATLASLVIAYEARLDAFFGEDEDAHERVAAARAAGAAAIEPRAVALASLVAAVLTSDTAAWEQARADADALGLSASRFGLERRLSEGEADAGRDLGGA